MPENNVLDIKVGTEKLSAEHRTFKTGSVGYWAGGKVTLNGKRYQVSISIVEIGSKPAA